MRDIYRIRIKDVVAGCDRCSDLRDIMELDGGLCERCRRICPDCTNGEIVLNPDWPSGTEPYSEKCSTCGGGTDGTR